LFGIGGFDKSSFFVARWLSDTQVENKAGGPVPLSTLLASSLGASFLLWLVLICEKIAEVSSILRTAFSRLLQYESVKKFVITSIGLTVALFIGTVGLVTWLIGSSWWLLIYLLT
jgi:hypothetical protein